MFKLLTNVSHTKLLHKLHIYGIDPETCGWCRPFLCIRMQHVVVHGDALEEVEITSGVPHGSVLGHIFFFLIYINDMAEYTKHSSVRLIADNTIIYLTLMAEHDCEKPEEELQALETWEADWLIEFHPDDCSDIRITRKMAIHRCPYTLHGQILTEETNANYPSVYLADKITWNTHIEQTAAKGNKKLGFLK